MNEFLHRRLRPVSAGLLLSVGAMLFGFGLGGAFGAKEDSLKGHLKAEAQAVLADAYGGDEGKATKVWKKSWVYLKRAHMHGAGLGAATLALILLLALVAPPRWPAVGAAVLLGLGSLGYPLFWLLAGLRAPGLGSTGAAKETLEWLAVPSAGALILGTVGVLLLSAMALLRRQPPA